MFYFAHPFGISTPLSVDTANKTPNGYIDGYKKRRGGGSNQNRTDNDRMASFIPWPRDTWKRDYILPPIVGMLARQMGKIFLFIFLSFINSAQQYAQWKLFCIITSERKSRF